MKSILKLFAKNVNKKNKYMYNNKKTKKHLTYQMF